MMETVLYLLFICFVIWLVFSLLPIILPIVLIIVVIASIYIWRLKRKIVKHMDEYSDDINAAFQDDQYQYHNQSSNQQEDIIDVEYNEREDDGR